MKKVMFLTMLFGLFLITAGNVSAQNACSKESDGVTVILDIHNETHNDIMVESVDQNCKVDIFSGKRIGKGEALQMSSYKDAVLRVGEAGKLRFLVEIVVDPAKPLVIVKTDLDGSNPKLISAAREDNGASNTEKTEVQKSENKTADTETSSQENSVSAVLFKEDDKKNCSPAKLGKKIPLKWINADKDYVMGFILIDSNCEAKGDYQKIGAGKTFTGFAYEGQIFQVIEHIESDENYTKYIKIDKSTATKTFGK